MIPVGRPLVVLPVEAGEVVARPGEEAQPGDQAGAQGEVVRLGPGGVGGHSPRPVRGEEDVDPGVLVVAPLEGGLQLLQVADGVLVRLGRQRGRGAHAGQIGDLKACRFF